MARTLAKTTTYAILHMTVAVAVAYALSGSLAVALGIGLLEPLVQTFAYHLHEGLWERLRARAPAGKGTAGRGQGEPRGMSGPLPA